jgi:hypothetical protein
MKQYLPFIILLLFFGLMTGCETQQMRQDRQAQQRYYQSLTSEQRERQDLAAMQALGMALSGGGPMRYAPVYQPPVMLPLQGYNYNQATRLRSNCLSQQYGNQTMTNCQ